MARSNSNHHLLRMLDRATLAGMALGVALLMQPWWLAGFRVGFFVTLFFTLAQIVVSHVNLSAIDAGTRSVEEAEGP